jgi:hypothetical protein
MTKKTIKTINKAVNKQLVRADIPLELLPIIKQLKNKGFELNKLFVEYVLSPHKFETKKFNYRLKYLDNRSLQRNAFSVVLKDSEIVAFNKLRVIHFQSVKSMSFLIILNLLQWIQEKKKIK